MHHLPWPFDLLFGRRRILVALYRGWFPLQLRVFLKILSLAFHLIVAADELWSEVKLCLEAQDRDGRRDGGLH